MNDLVDLKSSLFRGLSIAPQSVGAGSTVTGTAINCRQCGAEVVVEVAVGAVASGGTVTVTIESSLNDNTADAWAAADAYAQVGGGSETTSTLSLSGTDANTVVVMKCILRNEKFVRVKAVGAVAATLLSAVVLGSPRVTGTIQ